MSYHAGVHIRLLAFASAAEAMGHDELEFELPDSTTTDQLEGLLIQRFPALEALWDRLALAVDGQLVQTPTELTEGCEVALLPPVSGGHSSQRPEVLAELSQEPIDTDKIIRHLSQPDCGAVLLFFGNVRNHHQGRSVQALTYSAYESMARTRLQAIVDDLEDEANRLRIAIIHRVGRVPIGEPSVVIGVASAHREAAYAASRDALERLKREVPIWKFEEYDDGASKWREEEDLLGRQPNPFKITAP